MKELIRADREAKPKKDERSKQAVSDGIWRA